jgi:hypothetical protein
MKEVFRMTEPRATINWRRLLDDIRDPESTPVAGFTATVTYENNEAELQVELDPPLPGQPDQQEGFAQALDALGKALCQIAANPKAIQF